MKAQRKIANALSAKEKAEDRQKQLFDKLSIHIQKLSEARADGNIRKIEKAESDVLKAKEALQKAEEKLRKAIDDYRSAGGKQ